MCGRYYVDNDTAKEIERLVRNINQKLKEEQSWGEIRPTQMAPVILPQGSAMAAHQMQWGFPRYGKSGLLINARAETATERQTFCQSVQQRRCILPARLFFEWNRKKEKFIFERQDSACLYLAGIYNVYQGQERFVIITTQANASAASIHDRMPLVLEENEIENWMYDKETVEHLLHKEPPMLFHRKADLS